MLMRAGWLAPRRLVCFRSAGPGGRFPGCLKFWGGARRTVRPVPDSVAPAQRGSGRTSRCRIRAGSGRARRRLRCVRAAG